MTRLRSFFASTFSALDIARRVFLNLVFFVFVLFVLVSVKGPAAPPAVEEGMALVLDPKGMLVEEYDADTVERALNRLSGRDIPQVRIRDLKRAIEDAAQDDRIGTLILDLGGLWPAGLSKVQELGGAVQGFQATGKRVVAYADGYGQTQYYLAATADEIHTHPMGGVFMDGFGSWRMYMREALDMLMLDWHVFKAGDYKSFMEPYTRDDMSLEVREDTRAWLEALWTIYTDEVESGRRLAPGTVQSYADGLHDGMAQFDGSLARYALDRGLVDRLSEHDEFESRMVELVGPGVDGESFHGMDWRDYLASTAQSRQAKRRARADGQVAVLVMRGNITMGDPGLSAVGSDRMVGMIREARLNPEIKALVVRIDSPGGSAFASDLIRRELERFKETGRPLIVSMSSVAASGGYWIATPADEIWALPTTVTGSIGVISLFPTFPRTMDRIGLNTDGVGTTRLSGAFRPDRRLDDESRDILQALVDGVYTEFMDRVVAGRGMDREAVEEVAQGRVWSGADAHTIGLVDALGGIDAAVSAAADRAGIEDYTVTWLERPVSFRDKLLLNLLESRLMAPVSSWMARAADRPVARLVAALESRLSFPIAVDDPRHLYLYCFCVEELPLNPHPLNLRVAAESPGR